MRQTSDEDEEDDLIPLVSTSTSVRPPRKPSRQIRPPLPANLRPKLLVLASPSHLSTLASLITSPTSKVPTTLLVDFASFVLGLLHAFRGSPKWEGILEALMEGQRGRALGRRLWREGVRGRWRNSGERAGWDTFSSSKACLTPSRLPGTDAMARSCCTMLTLPHYSIQPLPPPHTRRRVLLGHLVKADLP